MVLAITGASGVVYAVRLLQVLRPSGCRVYLTISPSAQLVLNQELGLTIDLEKFSLESLLLTNGGPADTKLEKVRSMAGISSQESNVLAFDVGEQGKIIYHHYQDLMAPIASGSFLTPGMVICPCSGSTLGAVVHGTGENLIHRAAQVHLKERRKLILVPRETPLSTIQLDNMKRAAEAGAIVLPAMPGFYHGVKSVRRSGRFRRGPDLRSIGCGQHDSCTAGARNDGTHDDQFTDRARGCCPPKAARCACLDSLASHPGDDPLQPHALRVAVRAVGGGDGLECRSPAASRPSPGAGRISSGILLCMVTARSAAMAFNRIADWRLDAANPRTAVRHIPRGRAERAERGPVCGDARGRLRGGDAIVLAELAAAGPFCAGAGVFVRPTA